MIKLVTFQKRVASLTRPEFEQRWLTIHGAIAARFPGLIGYILGFSIEPGEPPADGVAQLWFESRAACRSSYASEIGRNGSADAIKYLARREHMLISEHWRSPGGSLADTPYKLVISMKRRAGQSRREFVDWLIAALPGLGQATGARSVRVSVDEAGQLLNSKTAGSLELVERTSACCRAPSTTGSIWARSRRRRRRTIRGSARRISTTTSRIS